MNLQLFNSQALSRELCSYLSNTKAEHVGFGIPGGRSPGKVLTPLAQQCPEELRSRLHLFWVDERCVDIGHPDRNDLTTLNAWKEGGAAPGHVHPMPAEKSDLNSACHEYDELLSKTQMKDGLHLALLGIGEDGHFASLFPNHPKLQEKNDVFAIVDSPKPPPTRLSFSLGYIQKSQRIDVLVFGADKGAILKQGFDKPSPNIPVSLLKDHHNIHFHLDEAAMTSFED
jgi:6-phosphogluconolactonase